MKNESSFLGKEKVSKLLFKLSMPSVVAMVVMSLFQIVDTIYVSRGIGSLGIAGITIGFPIIMFLMAIAQMFGVGVSSIVSRALGSNDLEKAKQTIGNYISIMFLTSLFFIILGNYFIDPMLYFFGATPDIFPYAKDYLQILFYGIFFLMFAMSANNIIRAQGHAKISMGVMLSSALANIIITPIFIFGLDMGMKGAAYGTIISYLFSSLGVIIYYFSDYNSIKLSFKDLKFNKIIISETIAIGLSSFARQVSMAIMILVVNNLLVIYGTNTTIAAYGIITRVMMFLVMPMFGMVLGMQPIVGYNHGAKKPQRVIEAIKLSSYSVSLVGLFSFSIIMLFPNFVASLFTSDIQLLEATASILRTVFLVFPIVGIYLIAGGVYQSLGKVKPALLISLLRQVILFIPLVIIFSYYFGLAGIWFAFPISDLIAGIVAIFFLRKETQAVL
ncbi:MAG: MATE family efflux transporter [Candidatus Woesearchaeota archaeon]|nr:MATE family efflux transporter [Candidatus Woesearchaeota archaeon]